MRKASGWDWLLGLTAWGFVSGGIGAFLHLVALLPEELATVVGMGTFFGGVALARFRLLRRANPGQVGLTTGEVQLARMEELEQRVAELEGAHARLAELEERMDFSERILARRDAGSPVGRADG